MAELHTTRAGAARPGTPTSTDRVNVALLLDRFAEDAPERLAVRRALPGRSTSLEETAFEDATFAAVAARSRRVASGLLARGLVPGDRVCLFVHPGADLVVLTYGLLRAGLVPVLIDPGMGRRSLLACVAKVRPRALVGVLRAHVAARMFPASFASAELRVSVGGRARGAVRLEEVEALGSPDFEGCETRGEDQAAVLFTSGSTGPPKGVVYTHAIFAEQVRLLRALYGFEPGEVDVACFPLFALFDNALGMTSVFPVLDPSRPARCRPERIVGAIRTSGATSCFASPAVWRRVVPWCERRGERLGGLVRALTAGAPIPPALVARLVALLPEGGRAHTPYGATECLPVADASDRDLLDPADRALSEGGAGNLVGHLAPGTEVVIAPVVDGPVARFDRTSALPTGEVGEVWVRSQVATPAYQFDEEATRAAKVATDDPPGYFHRMGDLGYLDGRGRLWFCGRKGHRLRTREGDLACVPVENLFLTHPAVARCALVGVGEVGREEPVLVVEPARRDVLRRLRRPRLAVELLAHARARSPVAERVREVLFHPDLPVDPRHNAKIHREDLKRWATARLS